MLGDSVVGVKHCIDPKGGKVTGATWALFGIGVASLLAFAFAFWTSVQNAAYNKAKHDYETTVLKKPGYSVRPRMLSGGFDFIAFGGVIVSLITMTAAVARMKKEKISPYVRIGTAPGVEFPIEQAPGPDFPLVAPHGDDFAFNFGHGMEGEMVVNGQSTSLQELAAQGRTSISPIPSGAKIRVRSGKATFMVSSVPRPRRHAMPLFAALESRVLAYFAGSLTVHMGFWLLLQQIPVEDSGTNIDLTATDSREGPRSRSRAPHSVLRSVRSRRRRCRRNDPRAWLRGRFRSLTSTC
jgi:hypothetical protein